MKENKMGTMPIGKLIVNMAVPMMLSMLVQAMYNIVDSIFVSRMPDGEQALTAISLVFPMQNLMIALGAGTGVGINALLSKNLGEKNYEGANRAANNGIILMLVNYMICMLFALTGIKAFLGSQTEMKIVFDFGFDYLFIIMMFSFGLFGQMVMERLLQSTGRTVYSMITQIIGAVINIILDPIMIYGLLGFPALGIKGAAIATVTGQIVAAVVGIIFNIKKNPELKLSFKSMKPDLKTIGRIYSVGIPSVIMGAIGSLMTYGLNRILIGKFNETAATVLGVYFKLQSFFFMPVFGLNNGLVPIISYNYGARNRERVLKTYKLGIFGALMIMFVGMLIFEIFPGQLLMLFDASPALLGMGIPALRIIGIHFMIAAYCIITMTMFQALGNGIMSMFVSICRQIAVLLPAAYFLSLSGNVDLVWFAFPIAEIASAIVSTICFRRLYSRRIKGL